MFYVSLSDAINLVKTGKYVFTGATRSTVVTIGSFFSNKEEYELSAQKERACNIWLPEYEAMQLAEIGYYIIKNDSDTPKGKMYEMAYNG